MKWKIGQEGPSYTQLEILGFGSGVEKNWDFFPGKNTKVGRHFLLQEKNSSIELVIQENFLEKIKKTFILNCTTVVLGKLTWNNQF